MAKLFYYDLETTGVRYWRNGIHQISGLIEIDGEVKETFNFHVRPNPAADIDPQALEIGGVTLEMIQGYPGMKEVHAKIIYMLSKYVGRYNKTDKFFLIGYNNSSFDDNFFKAFFEQNDDKYFFSWFWSSKIDVMVLASQFLIGRRHLMENFKLHTVAKELGIEVNEDNLHDALYDIKLTREIHKKILEKWQR